MSGSRPIVIAVDQGSSSTKALAIDGSGAVVARSQIPLAEQHPHPGWVEQDPLEISRSVRRAVAQCLGEVEPSEVAAIGLSTHRESIVVWERRTGRPVAPMISWQDSRAAELTSRLRTGETAWRVYEISGLPLDPMFSAAKAAWLLDRIDADRRRSRGGDLCIGTVDSWLLSGPDEHVIEVGNASRTQLLDVSTGAWSPELLEYFDIPIQALPTVRPSGGALRADVLRGVCTAPVTGVLGDSHAALFGHGVRAPGTVKATFGTGSSVMCLTTRTPAERAGLCLTVAWQQDASVAVQTALEGNIRSSGATLAWVARLFGITPAEAARLAQTTSSDGVHLVPGFNGLGAPWWDPTAVGVIEGLTLGSTQAHVCRAALEAIAFQVADLVEAVCAAGTTPEALLADGGASVNDTLMQLQADLAQIDVHRSAAHEASGIGAAHLAGLQAGVWDEETLQRRREQLQHFRPALPPQERRDRAGAWHTAIARSRLRNRA